MRKGAVLYIPYPDAVFPNRCIKTSQTTQVDYEASLVLPPFLQQGYQDSHIRAAEFYKILRHSKEIKLRVGLSEEWKRRRHRFLLIVRTSAVVGMLLCGLGAYLAFSDVLRAICLVASGILLVLFFQLPLWGWLRPIGLANGYLMVAGAGREFLDSLPEFGKCKPLGVTILSANYEQFPPEILGVLSNEGGKVTDDVVLQCKDCQGRWSVASTSSQINGDTHVALMEIGTCEYLEPGWTLESEVQVAQ